MGRADIVRNIIIIVLVAAITFSSVWLLKQRLNSQPPPTGVENRTELFRGYEAFVDRAINFAVAENWGMERTINENDVVLWVRVDTNELQVGDIIIYRDPSVPGNPLVASRIVEIVGDSFRTKGDALPSAYPYLVRGELEGIVIGVVYYRAP